MATRGPTQVLRGLAAKVRAGHLKETAETSQIELVSGRAKTARTRATTADLAVCAGASAFPTNSTDRPI